MHKKQQLVESPAAKQWKEMRWKQFETDRHEAVPMNHQILESQSRKLE